MEKESSIFLLHILNSICRINSYLETVDGEKNFYNNFLVQDAIIRNLQIIKAKSRLSLKISFDRMAQNYGNAG